MHDGSLMCRRAGPALLAATLAESSGILACGWPGRETTRRALSRVVRAESDYPPTEEGQAGPPREATRGDPRWQGRPRAPARRSSARRSRPGWRPPAASMWPPRSTAPGRAARQPRRPPGPPARPPARPLARRPPRAPRAAAAAPPRAPAAPAARRRGCHVKGVGLLRDLQPRLAGAQARLGGRAEAQLPASAVHLTRHTMAHAPAAAPTYRSGPRGPQAGRRRAPAARPARRRRPHARRSAASTRACPAGLPACAHATECMRATASGLVLKGLTGAGRA